MQASQAQTTSTKTPGCPALVMIVTAIVFFASCAGLASALVAYPMIYSERYSYGQTLVMGVPLAVVCILNIVTAFYTQKGKLWAYFGLLGMVITDTAALALKPGIALPAMHMIMTRFLRIGIPFKPFRVHTVVIHPELLVGPVVLLLLLILSYGAFKWFSHQQYLQARFGHMEKAA